MREMPELRAEIQRLLEAGEHDAVLARLEPSVDGCPNEVLECVGLTERAGDHLAAAGDAARSVRFWQLALLGWQIEASMATGAGEGYVRMIDVDRVHDKLARAAASSSGARRQ